MKWFGKVALLVGICLVVFALNKDVSVSTGSGGIGNNLGLRADMQINTILGGIIALAGLLMTLLSGKPKAAAATVERSSRPCPMCAETIKRAAIKCKHCGAEVPQLTTEGDVVFASTPVERLPKTLGDYWEFVLPCALLVCVTIGAVAYRMTPDSSANTAQQQSVVYKPKAEELVHLDAEAFGCVTPSDFDRAYTSYTQAEYATWALMITRKYCFAQIDLRQDISWTVMQVSDELMQIGLKRATEYSKAPDIGQSTYWTQTSWASPAQ